MNQTDNVLFEIDGRGVATVTLNQPEIHNAFDDKLILQLTDIFSRVDQNNDIRVMILAAAGKSFSAGADLNWMQRIAMYSYEQNLADANALARMFLDRFSEKIIESFHFIKYMKPISNIVY